MRKNNEQESCFVVQDDVAKLALDIIGECVFGYQFNSITDGESAASTAFQQVATKLLPFRPKNNTLPSVNNAQEVIKRIMEQVNRCVILF